MGQAQHGDLVAAGVDREEEPPVRAELDRALGSQARPQAGPADGKRRARYRCQRPVGVPVERCNSVGARRVVVDVDMPHDHR